MGLVPIVVDGINTNNSIEGEVKINLDHPDISSTYKRKFAISSSDSIVARWLMEDSSGSVSDPINGYNMYRSGANYSNNAYEGDYSMEFNRSNGEYTYTDTSGDIWNSIQSSNSFTFIGWVYLFQDDQQFSTLMQNSTPDGDNWSLRLGVNGGGNNNYDLFLTRRDSDYTNQEEVKTDSARLSTNSWHHVAFTSGSGDVVLYKNGSQVASGSMTQSIPSADEMYFGARPKDANPDWFDGRMDAIEIYNEALSSTQVSNHYNTGSI